MSEELQGRAAGGLQIRGEKVTAETSTKKKVWITNFVIRAAVASGNQQLCREIISSLESSAWL